MVGGFSITGKICWGPFCNLLRQSCDARGFEPLLIEIIAKRKVALAFEPLSGERGVATPASNGAPVCTCKLLF
jgi:hypothetical protein